MKVTYLKTTVAALILLGTQSCKKGEATLSSEALNTTSENTSYAADSISSVASLQIPDKQFIKTANVHMEVSDVYEATISIEKSLSTLNGFVTHSNLQSNIVSENTYNTSDENAMLVRKFQTENTMQVRVPTQNLGEFLKLINDKKVFLNSRIINAEDVTTSIKYAELEGKRLKKNAEEIEQLKTDTTKVKLRNQNRTQDNLQTLANLDVEDQLKYSTVDIYIKEPNIRVAEIAVSNSQNIDNKYKSNFIYSLKNAVIDGYYLIQNIIVALVTIWPILIVGLIALYFFKRNKIKIRKANNSNA